MSTNGIIDLRSSYSVGETADRLASLLQVQGIKIFARIDQAAEARGVGLTLPPMVLFIFGDPKSGTPLMTNYPSLAMDLPLKALVWESATAGVQLSYNSPEFLQQRHGLDAPPFRAVEGIFRKATQ
ncbi:MAG TPA: DUF302 domain-containing protein [Chthoniobacterales bacterium]